MAAFKGLPERIRGFIGVGHDEMRYAATISIWARWFVCLVCLILPFYRPIEIPQARYVTYILILVLLVAFNAYIYYRLLWRRMATWHWMLVISALDVALITAAAVTSGGFTHYFFYLIYYPALALFAVVFSSFALNLAWATLVAAVYTTISFTVGDGLDFEAREDKTLFARIVIMYAVVGSVNLVARFERKGRMEAVVREQALLRDRIELSQTIHDTTAQSAYMISLGIDAAIELAGESNQDLNATLAATSALSKAIMWELRRPIDAGHIFEGRALGSVLRSHTSSFTTITSVPAEMVQSGTEPLLSTEVRAKLFAIAHNALTNAFLHGRAHRVELSLDFQPDCIRLSVSDDGVGLPHDYAQSGHGFRNMKADAERMGGRLIVETGGSEGGTTIACVVPHNEREGRY